jgi:hypothetical protein
MNKKNLFITLFAAGAIVLVSGCTQVPDDLGVLPMVVLTRPNAPGNFNVMIGDGNVQASWGDVPSAFAYNLYYAAGTTITTTSGTKIPAVTSPRIISGLTNGTLYAFAITAQNSAGESDLSQIKTAMPQPAAGIPNAPSVAIISVGDGNVNLSWNAVAGATAYNLYYAQGPSVDKSGMKIPGVSSPRAVLGLANGMQYTFAVTALNGAGESGLSAPQTATPHSTVAIPGAPTITSTTPGSGSVTVVWNPVAGAATYNLYFKQGTMVDKASGTKRMGVTSPFVVVGLTNNMQYAFAVAAQNGSGESVLSVVKIATPQ